MACLDCDDNITDIPSGPAGPTGATGSAPVIVGTATDNVFVGTGGRVWTGLPTETAWEVGQRLRVVNDDGTKVLEGDVTEWTGGSLTLDVDYTEGAGSDTSWTIMITGERGATGATGNIGSTGAAGTDGRNAYGTTSDIAVSLGANLYTVPLTNTYWGQVGQYIYVATAGYYQITAVTAGVSFTVLDLLYSVNVPANMVASSGLGVSPAGIRGATGATGAAGAAGATGPTGDTGPAASFTKKDIASTSVGATVDLEIVASAASSGSFYLSGQLELESTDVLNMTVTLLIDGISAGATSVSRATGPTVVAGISIINMHYTNYFDIVAGESVKLKIELSSYASSSDITGRFVYAIM